ncbi:hypothetical protein BFJ68_g17605 [Fusarium oxysporum]|uniref:NB-ARC domain-containing protein n=1 Tax=Fusarium oxysporum TaxID=5507 RepID=A0A420NN28_FUSOX|nr:hypothetical protein BFJ68_g17605 [Fusarium oxysporum]
MQRDAIGSRNINSSTFGDNIRILQGDLNIRGLTINSAALTRTDYVGHYSHSSLQPVKTYVQRATLWKKIRHQLLEASNEDGGSSRKTRKTVVVWGLGGAGKTQLVLSYLHQHRNEYTASFWIEAGRKESVERDFLHIYQLLFDLKPSLGEKTVKIEDAVVAVKNWFHGRTGRWLLVFDGADTIDDEKDESFVDLNNLMPSSPSVHIIVTTRSRIAKDLTPLNLEVAEMEPPEASELFYKSSKVKDHSTQVEEEVKSIVYELGHLALAITLAGTYVQNTPRLPLDLTQYLPEYRQRRCELLGQRPHPLVHQYGESVLTTWETSFRAVARQSSGASRFLTLLSFLSFDDIYLDLFDPRVTKGAVRPSDSQELGVTLQQLISPGTELNFYTIENYFRVLQSFSLVQWKEDQCSYSIHKLVHAWAYARLSAEEQHNFGLGALRVLAHASVSCRDSPKEKLRLVPHLMMDFDAISSSKGGSLPKRVTMLSLLAEIGDFLMRIGRWKEAWMIRSFLFKEAREVQGEDHPGTISAMRNLAVTLTDLGKFGEALVMLNEVLERRERILGEEMGQGHEDTLKTTHDIAITLNRIGSYVEAERMHRQTLEGRKLVLGDCHPDTLASKAYLAGNLASQGRLEDAEELVIQALEPMKKTLGPEHPQTLMAIGTLASVRAQQGKLRESEEMTMQVLEPMKRTLGPEHPQTLMAIGNLVFVCGQQGRWKESEEMTMQALEPMKKTLGPEHPQTLMAIGSLALVRGQQGKLRESEELLLEALEPMKRTLGPEHPQTLITIGSLAWTRGQQGKLRESEELLLEALEPMKRTLGPDHPQTLMAIGSLVFVRGQQGRWKESEQLVVQSVEEMKETLGPEHSTTLKLMGLLAWIYLRQGRLKGFLKLSSLVLGLQLKQTLRRLFWSSV